MSGPVLHYQRGPDETERQEARQLAASRREAIIMFLVFVLIAAVAGIVSHVFYG